jgi:predicted nucleic acid-binding protein
MIFLDSNIWLYALLPNQNVANSSLAQGLIKNNSDLIVLSNQVIIEVAANMLRKGKFDEPEIAKFIQNAYQDYPVIDVSKTIMLQASKLRTKYSFSYFDSLIVSAALEARATTLYSEDMHHGLVVENQLTIVNPFI